MVPDIGELLLDFLDTNVKTFWNSSKSKIITHMGFILCKDMFMKTKFQDHLKYNC